MKAAKDSSLDELDAVPPGAFVRTRDALAERLRKAGRTREAAEVRRRRRPSVTVWLVNRVARVDPDGIGRLLEAADRLRRASLRDRSALSDATARHRAALQELTKKAEHMLVEADMRPTPETLRRVHATLSGVAADRDAHADLRRGRLSHEVEPSGFEVLVASPARRLKLVKPDRATATTARTARQVDARQRNAAEREQREAERRGRREAEAQRREAARREADALRRQRAIDRATRTADRLREELQKVEQRIERERRGVPRSSGAR
jgi:hypothetical protein